MNNDAPLLFILALGAFVVITLATIGGVTVLHELRHRIAAKRARRRDVECIDVRRLFVVVDNTRGPRGERAAVRRVVRELGP